MKKFIVILLFISCFMFNIVPAYADRAVLTQGIYKFKDLNLQPNIVHIARNDSNTRAILIIFDEHLLMQDFTRFEPNSLPYQIRPLNYNYQIVVMGAGNIIIE